MNWLIGLTGDQLIGFIACIVAIGCSLAFAAMAARRHPARRFKQRLDVGQRGHDARASGRSPSFHDGADARV